jgi:hypothetical protein
MTLRPTFNPTRLPNDHFQGVAQCIDYQDCSRYACVNRSARGQIEVARRLHVKALRIVLKGAEPTSNWRSINPVDEENLRNALRLHEVPRAVIDSLPVYTLSHLKIEVSNFLNAKVVCQCLVPFLKAHPLRGLSLRLGMMALKVQWGKIEPDEAWERIIWAIDTTRLEYLTLKDSQETRPIFYRSVRALELLKLKLRSCFQLRCLTLHARCIFEFTGAIFAEIPKQRLEYLGLSDGLTRIMGERDLSTLMQFNPNRIHGCDLWIGDVNPRLVLQFLAFLPLSRMKRIVLKIDVPRGWPHRCIEQMVATLERAPNSVVRTFKLELAPQAPDEIFRCASMVDRLLEAIPSPKLSSLLLNLAPDANEIFLYDHRSGQKIDIPYWHRRLCVWPQLEKLIIRPENLATIRRAIKRSLPLNHLTINSRIQSVIGRSLPLRPRLQSPAASAAALG